MISIDVSDGVAIVTLDWPERRNALDPDGARELTDALSVAHDDRVRGIILTGNGAFCSGGDLRSILNLVETQSDALSDVLYGTFQNLIRCLLSIPVPTVAAIDGPAIGLGLDLALACDSRVIGESGWLLQGWAALGLVPATGGFLLLQRLAPKVAWRLVRTQDRVSPEEAAEFGLADRAIHRSALDLAIARLHEYDNLPLETLRAYTLLSRIGVRREIEEYLGMALELQTELLTSPRFAMLARQALGI
jgi:2-(1,2-epoxy-1,2-dihydrophenyl)acetyl-CoA isomerase